MAFNIRRSWSLSSAILAVLLLTTPTDAAEPIASVTAVAVDPQAPTTVYAGTTAGVYRTMDSGKTWTVVGPFTDVVPALVVAPTVPPTVFAAVAARGIFKSSDEGDSWTNIGLNGSRVDRLAVDPQTPSTMYAVVAATGVLKSTDGGASWAPVFSSSLLPYDAAAVQAFAIDPETPATIYVTVFYPTAETNRVALFRSDDGGASWNGVELNGRSTSHAPPVDLVALAPDRHRALPATLFLAINHRLLKSSDGGGLWRDTPLTLVKELAFDLAREGVVYAAQTIGVSKSVDGGDVWNPANRGLTDTLQAFGASLEVAALAVDPRRSTTLYAATAIGVFKTTDGGDRWVPTGLIQHSPLASITIEPARVAGGDPATATVTLAGIQTTSVTVMLSTSDPAVADVPLSVIVPAGSKTATFPISTHDVLSTATVSVRAASSDARRGADLTVYAPSSRADVLAASASSVAMSYGGAPVVLPGTIEAENFDDGGAEVAYHDRSPGNSGGAYRATDVDLEATGDVGGGYNVGWVSAGEWLTYTVNVPTAGLFTIDVRVSSAGTGGTFHVEVNGADKTGAMQVPNTGDWQQWTTISQSHVALAAGAQTLRLVMDTIGSNGAVGNFNWIRVASSGGSTPYAGTPAALPGTIEAEHFDNGGAEVAYHDRSSGNNGGAYRATDVDLEVTGDAGGGYNVGWASAGEWLNYTVSVATAATYTIEVRVASAGAGGTFHVEVNGADRTGAMQVPNTGDWQQWTTISRTNVALTAGTQVLRLVMDTVGSSGAVGNFNWIRVVSGSTPYGGAPVVLPGTIEAENFDNGGAEVAYHDRSPGNNGGVYRTTDVDLETTGDVGGGYDVGWVSAGEWLTYTVNVPAAGTYTIEVRVASAGGGGTFHIEANGADRTGAMQVPNTDDWQRWTTISRSNVALAAGTQALRLVTDTIGGSGAVGNFNWIRVERSDTPSLFAITAPASGATLRTIAVTLEWGGAGDDFAVNIGSTPGAADVHASGSLGQTNHYTVPRVPLNGHLLYVEVRRRVGTTVDVATAVYTAPVRKALAVITDFTDRTLEDWTGAGMKSVEDVSAQLRKLEDHWAWLSHGLETFQWDIIRIQLPRAAVAGAYSSWWEFREAVAALVRQQVDLSEHDVDGNGVVDVTWAIVSSGDAPVGSYALGGSSMNGGVNMFVDGQASQSVIGGNTGNFTHEVAHLLGIPDMYGRYGTLGSVTIMSFSWDLPPGDFAAYERQALGWLTPQVIAQTTRGVWLPPATEQMAAVKVPTSRPSEYFLIEYRRKPSSGYGSRDVDYDGLIVYHVLEGSSMNQDPPIVKVEPADGRIAPSQPTDPYNFVYPGHPYWTPPLVLYSYFGDSDEVFRLDNVEWSNGGMSFDITLAPPQAPANLLVNGSFETGQGLPDDWVTGAFFGPSTAGLIWPSPVAFAGANSAAIDSPYANEKWWGQVVRTLQAGESYELCGWIKGEGIAGGGIGANVSLLSSLVRSEGRLGTFDWTQRCVTFTADGPTAAAACHLGFNNSYASGKLWCDDMTLVHVRRAF